MHMTLGNAIKLIRTARGLKQVTLAKTMDVSANYLSLIEKDKREPSISFLKKLASELSVPVSMFFMFQELESSPNALQEIRQLAGAIAHLQSNIKSERSRGRRTGTK
jgi:transcriptional regulator with XRE-family HTH domain